MSCLALPCLVLSLSLSLSCLVLPCLVLTCLVFWQASTVPSTISPASNEDDCFGEGEGEGEGEDERVRVRVNFGNRERGEMRPRRAL